MQIASDKIIELWIKSTHMQMFRSFYAEIYKKASQPPELCRLNFMCKRKWSTSHVDGDVEKLAADKNGKTTNQIWFDSIRVVLAFWRVVAFFHLHYKWLCISACVNAKYMAHSPLSKSYSFKNCGIDWNVITRFSVFSSFKTKKRHSHST